MGEFLSAMKRAERYLTVRALALERLLPPDGSEPDPAAASRWREYLDTVGTLARVREQLYLPRALPVRPARRLSG